MVARPSRWVMVVVHLVVKQMGQEKKSAGQVLAAGKG